ncbi:hypothetical protein BCV69DRAFT_285132 [Microstroma glucosiphilum]|uniref:PH domain-containing protein n=1 Tax=Pseudomicrostroma glucosiphilum TaxID=1684307 RepID=A0A316U248_9BASI|nr:hypothetical protein BCV69DRAFT_285132 [Pseudomicrostroma glucosiphilum]PWN18503.1 hypothetical protein BCV69DRAFT_285132 [Pseudomicrostroma glucosiphilum]
MTASRRGSAPSAAPSRRQSLISKQTAPVVNDLRPSDLLISRFKGWKQVTKQLTTYMEGIADIEYNTAKEYNRLGSVIQVPFREGNQFLGEGGMQDIFTSIRDQTRRVADLHSGLAKTVDSSIVQHLHRLNAEIKAHIKNIQLDTGKLADQVAVQRELSTTLIAQLAKSITALKNTPLSVNARQDPHLLNAAVLDQLVRQVHAENQLQKSILIMQQASAHFEEGIVRSLQSAWATYDTWQTQTVAEIQKTWEGPALEFRSLFPNKEWVAFAARSDCLLDPDTPFRNPEAIEYPGKGDPSVMAVHEGFLERKKRYTKAYNGSYYILTPAGFLHDMGQSSDPATLARRNPTFSLFLPECTLGPASALMSRSHKWHITVTSSSTQSDGSGARRSSRLFFDKKREVAYSFRARSHEEMIEWWNDIKQLSRVYLTSSEPMDRSGIVPAAVRAAGYPEQDYSDDEVDDEEGEEHGLEAGEEEEEDDEDAGGSSVDEETETEDNSLVESPMASAPPQSAVRSSQRAVPQRRVSIQVQPREGNSTAVDEPEAELEVVGEGVPGYGSGPSASSGIQIGPGGYAVEKKG